MYNHKMKQIKKRIERKKSEESSINSCIMHFMYLHCKLKTYTQMERNPSLYHQHTLVKHGLFKGQPKFACQHTHTHTDTEKTKETNKDRKNVCFREEIRQRDRFSKILLDVI